MHYTVAGVRIDKINRVEVSVKAKAFLSISGQKAIYTPNPEMLVKADRDSYFKAVLNRGDLNLCDGFGIRLASFFRLPRVTGVDCMLDLCGLAENEGKRIFLLGSGSEEVVAATAEALQKYYPKLKIAGVHHGPAVAEIVSGLQVNIEENGQVIERINQVKPAVLFVAFGMGKQEKWIDAYLEKMPSVKIAMGVGGAFDYISGSVPRAPLLLRTIGLEWLYRVIRQPWRMGRILNATVIFIFRLWKRHR